MAVRGWGTSVATAIGIAAAVGAAQLGLAYGLGIVAWLPVADSGDEAAWVASLAWAAWIAATSVVLGAVRAERLNDAGPAGRAGAGGLLITSLGRLALAVAAAVGALLTVALIAVPARTAVRVDTFSPQTIAAGYATIGVVVGLLVAIWALASRAAATNVIATVGWLWLLAVVAVLDGVIFGPGLTSAQLGVWQITTDSERYWFRTIYWPGAVLSLGSALLIGMVSAWPSARRARYRIGAAVSGGVGPLLIAAAYFLAAPRLLGPRAEQLSAHLLAPYAVIAGLAGSVLVTAMAQRAEMAAQERGIHRTRPGPGLPGEPEPSPHRDQRPTRSSADRPPVTAPTPAATSSAGGTGADAETPATALTPPTERLT